MPRRSVFDEELKLLRDVTKKNPKFLRDYADWRRKWSAKGPIKFAREILKIDPNTGEPLKLSSDQKEFLTDIWKRGLRLFIIAAGRGAGKTFILAVYITWRIFTHKNWHIASMGGSAEQTDKIRTYIMGWMRHSDDLFRFKTKMILTEIKTWGNSSVSFHACSGTSVRGPHCVSEDTMILTENGWKLFKDLNKNEKVATLNPDTQKMEYNKPTEIINEDYDGEMIHIKQQNIDLLVTPNHRLYIKTNRWGWKIKPLNDNFPKRFYMKRDCNGWDGVDEKTFELPEYDIYRGVNRLQHLPPKRLPMDLWLEFFGYYITEGNVDGRKIMIRQSKQINPYKYNKIKSCVQRMSFPYKFYDDKVIIYSTQLAHYLNQFGHYAWTKYIPKKLKSLSQRQLNILLDSVVIGDGHKTKTGLLIGSSSNQLKDDYMELGLKCGYSVVTRTRKERLHFFPKNNKTYKIKEFHEVYMSKKGEIRFSPKLKYINERTHYKGKVCCVNVPNHIILIKRNGKTVWSGNTHDIIIDEQAAGEEAGGTRFIKAAIWEVSTSPDIHIIKSSTCQFIHGDFLHTWNNAEALGFKRYRWSIAKHVNGEKDPYKVYQDHNPNNWLSNVPWIPDRNIQILRQNKSNDEWLVEALGGISITSGLVFNPADINACICDRCLDEGKECRPYEEGHCPVVQYYAQLEGVRPSEIPTSTKEALQQLVKERIEGIDWGKNAPCAYTAVGRLKETVFVLESKERVGMSDKEKIDMGSEIAKKWFIDILRPDPREWAYNNALTELGYAVHELFSFEGGQEKKTYVYTLKRIIERHNLVIPVAYEDLIRSLRNLAYDKNGKIRKADDHSFDSLLYATSYYGEVVSSSTLWDIYKTVATPKRRFEVEPRGFGSKNRPKKKKRGKGFNLW